MKREYAVGILNTVGVLLHTVAAGELIQNVAGGKVLHTEPAVVRHCTGDVVAAEVDNLGVAERVAGRIEASSLPSWCFAFLQAYHPCYSYSDSY